jgi:hypothetical protein
MSRKKDKIPSVRLRLGDLNIKLGVDPKLDALYEELNVLSKNRSKGRTILNRLLTGSILEVLAEPSQVEKAREAAVEILNMFLVED